MPMVEEFELLEEAEVQFEDSDCAESVWHGVGYCESLFCRKKPAAELTLVIRKEGILYFLCADLPEFQELCRLHGWYVVSHHPFSDTLEIGMCIMEAGSMPGGTRWDIQASATLCTVNCWNIRSSAASGRTSTPTRPRSRGNA